jgi:hypothetical protein
MSDRDHLKNRSRFGDQGPSLHEPEQDLFGGQEVGKRSATQDLVNPNVPVRESAFVKIARARREAQPESTGENAVEHVQRAAADTGSPLPEEVRGSFESSLGADLSGVRVHTGAESATAAASVGARAYTTGKDIHFGDDEYDPSSKQGQHLLAHEVAHTVQQGSGNAAQPQAKLDISNEGDAQENEADRAADAMIDGAPASVAKDSVGGHEHAVQLQRKAKGSNTGAPGQAGAKGDDKTRARAIITGYQAAQHELDKTGSPGGTLDHLAHVANVTPEYTRESDFQRVHAAADSFAHALSARSKRSPEKYQRLVELNDQIRSMLGLTKPSKGGANLAGGSDAKYASAAIGPALGSLALRTRDSLSFLEQLGSDSQGQRAGAIERIASDIDFTSEYVLSLLDELPGEARRGLAKEAAGAAHSVGRLLRWVRTRPAHEQLEASLLRGVSVFDRALTSMGTEPIANRDEVPLTEGQRHASEEEHAEFEQAFDAAKAAINSLHEGQHSTIELLRGIGVLDDAAKPPDFVPSLMNAIIDGLLNNSVAQFAKILGSAAAVSLPKAGQTIGLPAPPAGPGPTAENIWSIGLGSLKTAAKSELAAPPSAGGVDGTKLALHYFCNALKTAETVRLDAYVGKLDDLKKRSAMTAAQLRDIERSAKTKAAHLAEGYLQQITTAWAQYLAQSRLGTMGTGADNVSKMDDYFGEERPGGNRALGTSDAGGGGALKLVMRIERGAAKPILDPSATQIIGLNSVLKEQVLAGANHELDKVKLPKEVHVEVEFARATIALDEKNRIRDVINWHEVLRHVGGLSAYRFWKLWGKGLKVT